MRTKKINHLNSYLQSIEIQAKIIFSMKKTPQKHKSKSKV